MDALVRIAAVGTVLLGLAYVAAPRRMYSTGFDFLRGESSEPTRTDLWLHRIMGCGLVWIGLSHLP
ncbi:hypothetical protein SAMN05216559_2211 [Halomicrobium zhouii]|uniref:DUF6199 domain-containing protein n=1 Tax=Halomicrobium zhouii TaxID=767519 RepID=A0A1I6L7K4_9EURY|nr:hypothetical protein [Halomicrobium zhouii]SFR99456.1 hypothetical protein SAMN05216559_2211 [Halomicrobium zhouii]